MAQYHIAMIIGGLQKVSLVDYPGRICATLFLQGCNFRCPYCHNPELVNPELFQRPLPEDQVWSFLEKRVGKLDGVVITGGEPTVHKDLLDAMRRIKAMGLLVKLDTNGSHPDMLADIIRSGCVDYIAMDLKAPLERYPDLTGVALDTAAIQSSIRLIMGASVPYEFRTTLVRSLLAPDDVLAIGRLIEGGRRYALQRFVPSKHVEVGFMAGATYAPHELEALRAALQKNVEECIIR